jgi:capsular exopolysaccharide synthesis family protein
LPPERLEPGGDGPIDEAGLSRYGYEYGDGYGPFLRESGQARASQMLANLRRYELALRKHWWIPLLALCVALAPLTWHIYSAPPAYSSTAKVMVSGKLNVKEGQLFSEEVTGFLGTQVELLKSAVIFERALARLFTAHPDWTNAVWATNLAVQPFGVQATDVPKASIIEIKATGEDGKAVQAFLEALTEEYRAFRKEMRTQSSDVAADSVNVQVKQLEADIKSQKSALEDFRATNDIVLISQQGNSAGAYAATLSRQLAGLQTELQLLQMLSPEQLVQANTRTRFDSDGGESVDASRRELLTSLAGPQADFFKANQQIELLKAQRAELSQFLRPNHPKIIKLEEETARQTHIVEVFHNQSRSQMDNRRQALSVQITNLMATLKEWEDKAIESSRKLADYDAMRQDFQRSQGLYDRMVGVVQSVDLNRALDQEVIRVMEHASPPKPVRQARKLLALGGVAGLFVGMGLLYLISLFDDRFTSVAELRNQLAEMIVGHIPEVRVPKDHPTVDLIHTDDERHVFTESFRNIRSWMLFSYKDDERPRLLLVTSAMPAEGKSTVAANLAVTLALAGSRVLLIDGDLRRASLHPQFKARATPGFAEILQQEARAEDAIVQTFIPKLCLLPAGKPASNPGELFLAPSLDLFLARLRDQFDYVVFDSAPITATDDTSNLAPKLEAVLFVVRADYTSTRAARESLACLHQRRASILGLVFNRAAPGRGEGYYHYYRYKDYYYAKGRKEKQETETVKT